MIPVTFDRDYIDDLQDYYHRNECIREQQYLSPEKPLHLAAFCVSKAATDVNENQNRGDTDQRQKLRSTSFANYSRSVKRQFGRAGELETVIVVTVKQTAIEKHENDTETTAVPPTMTESCDGDFGKLRAAVNSTLRDLVRRLNICWKTPRV